MDRTLHSLRVAKRLCALALGVSLLTVPFAASADTVTDNGSTWLIAQQLTTPPQAGAFPWTPGGGAYANTQGATALGLLRAHERSGDPAALDAAIASGDCQIAGSTCVSGFTFSDGDHKFSRHDPLFLIELSQVSGDAQYANFVTTELWDKLTAGTYGEGNDQDADDLVAATFAARSTIPELVAWDLSKLAIAAHRAGQAAIASDLMDGVLQSLNLSDTAHSTYDVIGLAGAVWAAAETGVDLDPTAGKWSAANSTADLAGLLQGYQASGGGFVVSTNLPGGVIDANTDIQVTSFAMQALDAVDANLYATVLVDGFAYITSLQEPSGEFLVAPGESPGSAGAVEVQGETLEAYASVALSQANVYVDDNWIGGAFAYGDPLPFSSPPAGAVTAYWQVNAFASIAEALDHVDAGGNVYVAEGTYAEGDSLVPEVLYIDRPVNLIGAQAGVDARNRSDTGASILRPAFVQSGLSTGSTGDVALIYIDSSDVVVDGFVLDGDNPGLTSPVTIGGANPDVDSGVFASGTDIKLRNNVVRNLVYTGIFGYNYPASMPAGAGNVIRNNWIDNIDAPSQWGLGVVLAWNYYADVDANLFTDVRVGIQTNYNFKPTANPAVDAHIHANEIHASVNGIYHNYQDGLGADIASPYTIDANQILATNNPAASGAWVGFAFQGLYESTAIINGNSIDGSVLAGSSRLRVGYRINLITSPLASATSVNGGTVSHVDYGVLGTDGAYYSGSLNDMNLTGIAFDDVSVAAFYIEDTALAGTESIDNAPKLTIGSGNTYSNVAHQAALAGPLATFAFAAGVPNFDSVLVRSANAGHRPGLPDSNGNVRQVANAIINAGIGIAAVGGTIDVEQGTFAQSVEVNKGVTLRGAFAGTPGHDVGRDGVTDETILQQSGPGALPLRIDAANIIVDGFAINDVSGHQMVLIASGAGNDGIRFINNRLDGYVSDWSAGTGLQVGTTTNLEIADNLFRDFVNGGPSGKWAMGIRLDSAADAQVHDNVFFNVQSVNIQVTESNGADIFDNNIDATAAPGTGNAGIQVAENDDVQVRGNTIAHVDSGLLITPNNTTSVNLTCNTVRNSTRGIFALGAPYAGTHVIGAVLHNDIQATTLVQTNWAAGELVVGSNYYGGATASSPTALIADPLSASPIGNAECGNNTATAIVAYAGTPQNTQINTTFAQPLVARVQDALGGAVAGEPVDFAAPVSGASAALASPNGSSDFNGTFSTTATANGIGGSYNVNATSGTLGPAAFALSNDRLLGTVTWDALTFVYDGSAKAPTAFITEEPGSSCSITPATVGPAAGSYAVTATCIGIAYQASGAATATITPAPAAVVLSNLVQQYDGTPKPVTVTTTPTGVAVNVTYDGSGTAPSAVGSYAVVATVSDPNYTGSAAGVLQITDADAPDAAVSISDGREFQQYGELLSYAITVSNLGNVDLPDVDVSVVLPADLVATGAGWTCIPIGAATCTPSGSGDVLDSANLPQGSGVVYLIDATILDSASADGVIDVTATISAAGDVASGNDSASDQTIAVLLRDGFEVDGDGAESVTWTAAHANPASLTEDSTHALDLSGAWASQGRVLTLASLRGGNGDDVAVQTVHVGERLFVRMVGTANGARQSTAWTEVAAGTALLSIGQVRVAGQAGLLLVGALAELNVPLSPASTVLDLIAPRFD